MLEALQAKQAKQKEILVKLKELKINRGSIPDWQNCVNVSMETDKDLSYNWELILNMLAAKLADKNKQPLEMLIAKTEHGRSTVFIRTGENLDG